LDELSERYDKVPKRLKGEEDTNTLNNLYEFGYFWRIDEVQVYNWLWLRNDLHETLKEIGVKEEKSDREERLMMLVIRMRKGSSKRDDENISNTSDDLQ
jgi:hypothetical protein